jgi:N-carbamoyl-L-amino-acid hydrolase
VTREAYGRGEQFAHDLVATEAQKGRLAGYRRRRGQYVYRLAGSKPNPQTIIVGSHLDSVPMGGNYDGAAGVLTGLRSLSAGRGGLPAWRRSRRDGDPCEESNWFRTSYIGSKGGARVLPDYALDVRRSDSGARLPSI